MKNGRRALFIFFFILFSIVYFYNHKYRAVRKNYSDFRCFYTAGQRMLDRRDIYVAHDKEAAEFRYAPIFALLMSAFALMDIDKADSAWFIVNYLLLILSVVLLIRMLIRERLSLKSCAYLAFLLALGTLRFIFPNFDNGQSNILMMSAIIAGLYYISRGREAAGGIILAFSILIKYTPAIFIPYFFFRKKIKAAFAVILGVAIYLFLPALFIGVKTNFYYLNKLIPFLTQSTILEPATILDPKNQSLASAIKRQFTYCISTYHAPHMLFENIRLGDALIGLIFILLSAVIYALIFTGPGREKKPWLPCNLVDYAMLLICACLFNLNAWMQSYILLLMPYFIVIYYLIRVSFKDKAVFALLLLSYLLNIITIKGIFGNTFTGKAFFYSPFTLMALVLFLALLKIKLLGLKPAEIIHKHI